MLSGHSFDVQSATMALWQLQKHVLKMIPSRVNGRSPYQKRQNRICRTDFRTVHRFYWAHEDGYRRTDLLVHFAVPKAVRVYK